MTRTVYQLAIGQSNWIKGYLISLQLLAIFMVVLIDLSVTWQSLLVLLCAASFYYYYLCYFDSESQFFVQGISRDDQGMWTLVTGSELVIESLELTSTVVTGLGTILYYKRKNRLLEEAVVVSADAVGGELYRQLRVFCRHPETFQK